jgi:hypothetical protein
LRVKKIAAPVEVEPPRSGEDAADCVACNTPDDAYIWVSERWRVRAMDRPTGLPIVLILECRSHLDLGDLPNLLAAELGVMTVRLERAIRSLDGVARVHVNRWGDGSAHLHMWFLARPYGQLQLRGTFLSLWDDILPRIPEQRWRENLADVAAWLAEFGGSALAEPPHIQWQSPSTFSVPATASNSGTDVDAPADARADRPAGEPEDGNADWPADGPADETTDRPAPETEARRHGADTGPNPDAGADDSGSDARRHSADAASGSANAATGAGWRDADPASGNSSTPGTGPGDTEGRDPANESAQHGADRLAGGGAQAVTGSGADQVAGSALGTAAGSGPGAAAGGEPDQPRGTGAISLPRQVDHDSPAPALTANEETGR